MLEKTLQRNLLKYSAGRAITCPKCGKIADYRSWVIWESPNNRYGAHCADCWREGLALIHDDKPHSYLISIGWKVDTLVDFEKKARKPASYPQKPGKVLDTFLRKDIAKGMKANGYQAKSDRFFPAEAYGKPVELIDTLTPDGADVNYAENAEYSAHQVQEYCREYCKLNNLTM